MTGICFYYERPDIDVWSGKKLDAWNYAMKAAGDIQSIIVINESDTPVKSPCRSFAFYEVANIDEAASIMEGMRVTQVVTPWEPNDIDPIILWDFDHKTDWYVFGPARGWTLPLKADTAITVPQAGHGALHAVHVATTILLHRYWALVP